MRKGEDRNLPIPNSEGPPYMKIIRLLSAALFASTLFGCASQGHEPLGSTATPQANAESSSASPVGDNKQAKSENGSMGGEIVGNPAPNSKFAKLKIGMSRRRVEDLIGRPNHTSTHITGKQFIPFYFGGDSYREEDFYRNEGVLTYSNSHFGGEANRLIRIQVDKNTP
ncbi:MAG: hypothetical protein ACYDCX_10655 [Acidithiobacillus sp.]